MQIQWMANLHDDEICLSPVIAGKHSITTKPMTFHFGGWNHKVKVTIGNAAMKDGTIGLPAVWRQSMTIPETLIYDFYRKENELHLGPVLALIAFSNQEEMTLSNLKKHQGYFQQAKDIKGLLYLCSLDGIDLKSKRVQGYYYDPYASKDETPWKAGTFPYPGAAYNRTAIPKEMFDDLNSANGQRIFNSFSNGSFNKWDLWNRLSPIRRLRDHLPETRKLLDSRNLYDMLARHNEVYLKPVGGTLSKGISKVAKSHQGLAITRPNRTKGGSGTTEKLIVDGDKMDSWIHELADKDYIVQQAIAMKRYEERAIDFRVIMQKNGTGEWVCLGVFGRFGKPGSIITNFTHSGYVLPGEEAFMLAFGMTRQQSIDKTDELKKLGRLIGNVFDGYGLYADLGIDLMVDETEKLWILEVNTLDTYHGFPLHTRQYDIHQRILTNPLAYAKYLANFMSQDSNE